MLGGNSARGACPSTAGRPFHALFENKMETPAPSTDKLETVVGFIPAVAESTDFLELEDNGRD